MPVTFKHTTLENGLTIIGECDDAAHTAACGFFVKTGARDEDARVMGVSHFLEHMMFKGTAKRNSDQINKAFDGMGARSNAYTSSEMTAFHAAVLPDKLPHAMEVLADMMRPALRQEDFAMEKGVILEEIAMYKDDPGFVLYESGLERHYSTHPLAHRVLGTEQTITDLSVEQMREYFVQRYSADNTVLALAGKVDFDDAVARARELCGGWMRTGATRVPERPSFAGGTMDLRDARVSRAYRMLLSEAPGASDDRRYAAFVLALLLGGPDNSRLHWSLIEPGLAEEAEASYDPKDGVGDFRVFVACEPERLDEVWEVVEREIENLASAITPEDVQRIRAKVATGVTLAGEQPEGRMHRLGRMWLCHGQYTTLAQELERITAVGVQDVIDLIKALPMARSANSPRTIATMLPGA
ncbi:MAG: M16 family metallopeptidase [Phycisphaerales bacterium]|jgi:predicted Zn-dependent peptidase|nr:insulinase family protein [Phycisphaeraceae bacterium]